MNDLSLDTVFTFTSSAYSLIPCLLIVRSLPDFDRKLLPTIFVPLPCTLYKPAVLQMHPAQPGFHDRMLRQTMDAADPVQQAKSLTAQGCFLVEQERRIRDRDQHLRPTHRRTYRSQVSGDHAQCRGFLLQCHLYFAAQERISDQAKMNILMSLLTGDALRWATAV